MKKLLLLILLSCKGYITFLFVLTDAHQHAILRKQTLRECGLNLMFKDCVTKPGNSYCYIFLENCLEI